MEKVSVHGRIGEPFDQCEDDPASHVELVESGIQPAGKWATICHDQVTINDSAFNIDTRLLSG